MPPYAIVAGVPAKIVRYRFDEETIRKLIDSDWWNKSVIWIKKNIDLFESASVFIAANKSGSSENIHEND